MSDLSDSDYALIEAKIDGSLKDQEIDLFEEKIKNSKEFEAEFRTQKAVIHSLIGQNREELRQELQGFLDESRIERNKKPASKTLMLAAAVSILILSSLAYFLVPQSTTDPTALYQSYFEVYPAPPITRGDETSNDFDAYRQRDYIQAQESLLLQPKSDSNSLYLAMCYLETNQVNEAVAQLTTLTKAEDTMIKQTADWYLALAYLKQRDVSKSIELLKKITSNQQLYDKQAIRLLEDLD